MLLLILMAFHKEVSELIPRTESRVSMTDYPPFSSIMIVMQRLMVKLDTYLVEENLIKISIGGNWH